MDVLQKALGGTTAVEGIFTTLMGWFDIHAAGVGAICTVITLVVYLIVTGVKLKIDLKKLSKDTAENKDE